MRTHFRPDLKVEKTTQGSICLSTSHVEVKWQDPSSALQRRIRRLEGSGSPELYEEEAHELPELFPLLELLESQSLLSYTVLLGESPLVTLTPFPHRPWSPDPIDEAQDARLQLSRFAYMRSSSDGQWVLESPLMLAHLTLKDQTALDLIQSLHKPISLNELIGRYSDIPEEVVTAFWNLLQEAQLLSSVDNKPSLLAWEFHDLLFHTHSRKRHTTRLGGTFRFLDQVSPSPAIKSTSGHQIPLYKPDLEEIEKSDPSFAKVIAGRQSVWEHNDFSPITDKQLGEFLYRTARVKEKCSALNYEATKRPYPSAGGCYELEIYPLICNCEGLEKGLYRYVPDQHTLETISIDESAQSAFLKAAMQSTGTSSSPQILMLISARFHRMNWKYETMAYAAILKNTGVLLQSFYLTATAMGLAPCAIGGGDSDQFAKALGLDYYEETTVGEFMLGSR